MWICSEAPVWGPAHTIPHIGVSFWTGGKEATLGHESTWWGFVKLNREEERAKEREKYILIATLNLSVKYSFDLR